MANKNKREAAIYGTRTMFENIVQVYHARHDTEYLNSAIGLLMPYVDTEIHLWVRHCLVKHDPVHKTAEQISDAVRKELREYVMKQPAKHRYTHEELMHEARAMIHRVSRIE